MALNAPVQPHHTTLECHRPSCSCTSPSINIPLALIRHAWLNSLSSRPGRRGLHVSHLPHLTTTSKDIRSSILCCLLFVFSPSSTSRLLFLSLFYASNLRSPSLGNVGLLSFNSSSLASLQFYLSPSTSGSSIFGFISFSLFPLFFPYHHHYWIRVRRVYLTLLALEYCFILLFCLFCVIPAAICIVSRYQLYQ